MTDILSYLRWALKCKMNGFYKVGSIQPMLFIGDGTKDLLLLTINVASIFLKTSYKMAYRDFFRLQ